jgi:competence protein ComEC
VRATGYVAGGGAAKRLPGTAGGIATSIDRLRYLLREHIARALTGAAHSGIVAALAVGAQDAISELDRLVLRRTGTSHLVAMKW